MNIRSYIITVFTCYTRARAITTSTSFRLKEFLWSMNLRIKHRQHDDQVLSPSSRISFTSQVGLWQIKPIGSSCSLDFTRQMTNSHIPFPWNLLLIIVREAVFIMDKATSSCFWILLALNGVKNLKSSMTTSDLIKSVCILTFDCSVRMPRRFVQQVRRPFKQIRAGSKSTSVSFSA